MKYEVSVMDAKSSVSAGTPIIVDRFEQKIVHIHSSGAWNATIQVEGVVGDHDDWTLIGLPMTANGFVLIPQAVQRIRVNTTAYVSGTLAAHFGGFDSRSM